MSVKKGKLPQRLVNNHFYQTCFKGPYYCCTFHSLSAYYSYANMVHRWHADRIAPRLNLPNISDIIARAVMIDVESVPCSSGRVQQKCRVEAYLCS